MALITIWHNPRCSKSRQTLALLMERGVELRVVEYLKTPPTADDIRAVVTKLGITPIDLMRVKEARFKELGLDRHSDADALIAAMAANPILIERPVVITDTAAAIGRPPEAVLDVLSDS